MSDLDLNRYIVVRDRDALWARSGAYDDFWWKQIGGSTRACDSGLREPITPLLDLDGLPVVRTVGDLTARHIGRRVRVYCHTGLLKRLPYLSADGWALQLIEDSGEPLEVICQPERLLAPCEVLS